VSLLSFVLSALALSIGCMCYVVMALCGCLLAASHARGSSSKSSRLLFVTYLALATAFPGAADITTGAGAAAAAHAAAAFARRARATRRLLGLLVCRLRAFRNV